MAKQIIIIEAEREGYSVDQIHRTMTAGELKEVLDQWDDSTPVYLSHDNGYTYGGIRYDNIDSRYVEEDNYEED